ncbi:unnamed protein product [marine sediment metagenome]|uniref:Uncharacterized protein n=1 Tax=marine sediment metagenome TaxID=412755 RepID=X0UR44_9ZZZZ
MNLGDCAFPASGFGWNPITSGNWIGKVVWAPQLSHSVPTTTEAVGRSRENRLLWRAPYDSYAS